MIIPTNALFWMQCPAEFPHAMNGPKITQANTHRTDSDWTEQQAETLS